MEVNGYEIGPGASLAGADLEEAVADEGTIWPKGFEPKAAGVIFASERPPGYPTWDVPLGAH